MRRGQCVFSGDYGENRGDAGMDEAEADRAWLYVPGFEGELYFCNAQNRPGAGVIREPENSRNLCAIFQKPRIDNYLRITVGTQAEMERLVEVLVELVK